jgi:G3E family GTPase
VPVADVLDRKAFDLDRIMEVEPEFLEAGHHHHHDEEIDSFSFRTGEVNPDKFMPWISDLTQREGPNILRCKGIVAFPKEPKRFVFQGVHMILDGDQQRDWRPDEKRESRVVFIGRDLNQDAIREGFLACVA